MICDFHKPVLHNLSCSSYVQDAWTDLEGLHCRMFQDRRTTYLRFTNLEIDG